MDQYSRGVCVFVGAWYINPTATSSTLSRRAKLLKLSQAPAVRLLIPCSASRSVCWVFSSRRGIVMLQGGFEMVRVGVGANACGAWFIKAGVASQITTSSRRVRSGHITRVSVAGTSSCPQNDGLH